MLILPINILGDLCSLRHCIILSLHRFTMLNYHTPRLHAFTLSRRVPSLYMHVYVPFPRLCSCMNKLLTIQKGLAMHHCIIYSCIVPLMQWHDSPGRYTDGNVHPARRLKAGMPVRVNGLTDRSKGECTEAISRQPGNRIERSIKQLFPG